MTDINTNRTDNHLLARLDHRDNRQQDSFGEQVSHGITNTVTIPSFYPFSAERLRYIKNGTRIRDRNLDGETTFTDREQDWLLEPASGDTLELRTAERPRYVVGVDAEASLATFVPSGLGSGDQFTFGLNDRQSPENGAFVEINGDSNNRVGIIKGGTEIKSDTWEFPHGIDETNVIRWSIKYQWYGAGSFFFKLFYSDGSKPTGEQNINETVAELSVPNQKLTNDANFHIFQKIDASSSDLQIGVGSFGHVTKGSFGVTERVKSARITGASYSGTGNYEPLLAVRIDPPRGNIFAQMERIEAVPSGGDGVLLAEVMPQDETDASDGDFSVPPELSPGGSVIQQTTNITQFTDQSGTLTTDASNPDGYQVGFYVTDAPETGQAKTRVTTQDRSIRPIYEDDVVVFLYKDDTSTSRDVNVTYRVKELW